jgi:hypothetical protein
MGNEFFEEYHHANPQCEIWTESNIMVLGDEPPEYSYQRT